MITYATSPVGPLILTALRHEHQAVCEGLRTNAPAVPARLAMVLDKRYQPQSVAWGTESATVCRIGVGPINSHRALNAIFDQLDALKMPAPERILLVGFSGGLVTNLRVGQLVVANAVHTSTTGSIAHLPTWIPAINGSTTGPIVSAANIMETSAEKQQLHGVTGGIAVDMESASVIDVVSARHSAVPFGIVRAISDAWNETLPKELLSALKPDGSIAWLRFARGLLSGPSYWSVLARLQRASREAGINLANGLRELSQIDIKK